MGQAMCEDMERRAAEELAAGHFWEGHRFVRQATEAAYVTYFVPTMADLESEQEHNTFLRIFRHYCELEVQRHQREDRDTGELPREHCMTREEAEKEADQLISDKSVHRLSVIAVRLVLAIAQENWSDANQLGNIIMNKGKEAMVHADSTNDTEAKSEAMKEAAQFNVIALTLVGATSWGGREASRRSLWNSIWKLEGIANPLDAGGDPELQRILVDVGLIQTGLALFNHAMILRKSIIGYFEAGDRLRAWTICKRFMSLLKACQDPVNEWFMHWPNLDQVVAVTESMLFTLSQPLATPQVIQEVESEFKVSVSMMPASPVPGQLRPPTDQLTTVPGTRYSPADFKGLLVPGEEEEEQAQDSIPPSHLQAMNLSSMKVVCEHCGWSVETQVELVPTTCYMVSVAVSAVLIPVLVGIIPFGVLLVLKPCHEVQHSCPRCNELIVTYH